MFLTCGVIANTNIVCICLFSVYVYGGFILSNKLCAFRSNVICQLFYIRNQIKEINNIIGFSNKEHRVGKQTKSAVNVFEFFG